MRDKNIKRTNLMRSIFVRELKRIFADAAEDFPTLVLAYLFGSRLEGDLGPMSDYDIAVLFRRDPLVEQRVELLRYSLAKKLKTGRLDVVELNKASVEFAFSIISSGALVYEQNVQSRVEYEARVMGLYFDYLPVLRTMRRDILEGDDHAARVQRYRKTLGRTQRALGEVGCIKGKVSRGI